MPNPSPDILRQLIAAARNDAPVDILFVNARVINVFSGEIHPADIAVHKGFIVGFGDYEAARTVDLRNRYVAPGLIDAHVHIESSMTTPSAFAAAVMPRGTLTAVADPHEIANVLGAAGIDYLLDAGERLPMNLFFALPSCVPATAMETPGAVLDARALAPFWGRDRIVALAEMMNFPGVIGCDKDVMEKMENALAHGKVLDGHCPGLTGKALNAYLVSGIASDHECTTAAEAREKLEKGMHIMIREGTGAKNLKDLLPVITQRNAHRVMWCTDDRHPADICDEGHIDFIIRRAVAGGLDPVTAITIGTLNPARYFGLKRLGAIAPGRKADMVIFSDLRDFTAEQVVAGGRLVAENGRLLTEAAWEDPSALPSAMNVGPGPLDFRVPAKPLPMRVISLVPGQVVTAQVRAFPRIHGGAAVSDTERDMLKIAVVERHRGTGHIGRGFVMGFGLKQGALASSVAHDSHHLITVGVTDGDMACAVRRVMAMNGGLAVARDGEILAELPLPVAGLMSPEPLAEVRRRSDAVTEAARALGSVIPDPFMALSFLALPVIPELKITDLGLFDVVRFRHTPLYCED